MLPEINHGRYVTNDPHVESLTYKIVAGEGIEFDNPKPLEHKTDSFSFKLENGIMIVTPEDHFSTKGDARAAVEPYLDAWEFEHALRNGRRNVTFKYGCEDHRGVSLAASALPALRAMRLSPVAAVRHE